MYELLVGRTDGRTDRWLPGQWTELGDLKVLEKEWGEQNTYWGYHKKYRRTLSGQTAKKTDGQTLERTDRHTNIRRVFSNSGSCCALL